MAIKEIDRKVIRTINADIDEALKAVGKKIWSRNYDWKQFLLAYQLHY